MAYMGTDDPDGWVICNGTQRTNGSDGKYNNLIAAKIGSWTANTANYTPPDYRGAFLRGTGTNGTDTTYSGESVGTKQLHATQTHTHSASQASHFHANASYTMAGNGGYTRAIKAEIGDLPSLRVDFLSELFLTNSVAPAITVNDSSTVGQKLTDLNETRPYNYGVNWIIKL
jgi:hypothetical protein